MHLSAIGELQLLDLFLRRSSFLPGTLTSGRPKVRYSAATLQRASQAKRMHHAAAPAIIDTWERLKRFDVLIPTVRAIKSSSN
jgi:hypothetical protein